MHREEKKVRTHIDGEKKNRPWIIYFSIGVSSNGVYNICGGYGGAPGDLNRII